MVTKKPGLNFKNKKNVQSDSVKLKPIKSSLNFLGFCFGKIWLTRYSFILFI